MGFLLLTLKKKRLNKELAESPQYLTLVDATKMKNLELREAAEKEAKEKQVELDKKYEKSLHTITQL